MEAIATHLGFGLAAGLLACAHCLGMCGGFVLNLSLHQERARTILAQMSWHAGRICSYACLGAIAGYAGGYAQGLLLRHMRFQHLLAPAAGAVIALMGLRLLGLLPVGRSAANGNNDGPVAALYRLLSTPAPGAALLLGMATGLLPCPIVLALLAYALQSASVATGLTVMAGLGLGTLLPLLALGTVSRMGGLHRRAWSARTGGIALVALGVLTMLRGTEVGHRLLGSHHGPASPHSSAATAHPRPDKAPEHGHGH
jgi:sulfite exporter TauE/SafE